MSKAVHYGDMSIVSSGKAIVSFSKNSDKGTVTKVAVHTEDKTGYIASWGSNNDYPQKVLKKARLNGVAMSGLRVLRKNHYGGGFVLMEESFTPAEEGKPSKRVLTPKSFSEFPEINEFWKRNQMNRFHKETITDLETWAMGFPEYILSNDYKTITRVKRQQTANCRFEVMNEKTGYIKNIWISHKWEDGVDLKSNFAKPIPLIDSYWTPQEVKDYCKKNKIHNFSRPVFYPLLNEGYYAKADWHAVIDNGWIDVSNSIPEFKKALFENQLNIKYHIEVSEEFFERKYKNDWTETFDDNKRAEIQKQFVEEIDASLRDNKNAGTSIFSMIYTDDNGEQLPGLKITAIDNKIKDGAYLPEASAANSEILSAQGVDVGLIGHGIPGGKTLNGSGSDKRIAWEIQSSMMKSNRETTLETFEFIRDYNGWPENLFGTFENTTITTLDVNPTGTQNTVNT